MLREIGLQFLQSDFVSFAFTLSSQNSVSNQHVSITFACIAVWLCQHANINISKKQFFLATEHKPQDQALRRHYFTVTLQQLNNFDLS